MQEPAEYETKSRPVYPPVLLNPAASFHVFITEESALLKVSPMFEACDTDQKILLLVGDHEIEGSEYQSVDVVDLPAMVEEVLTGAPVSTTVYVSGQESFLWDVRKMSRDAGLASEQVLLVEPAQNKRRLFCTHCHEITEDVTHTPATCSHCGRLLLVRDHFSRLHGAYVGVQINAEDAKDIPATEELM